MTVLTKPVSSPPPTSLPPASNKTDVATLARVGTVAEIQTFLKANPGQQGAMETAMAKSGRVGDLGAVAAKPAAPESPTDWAKEVMSWTTPNGIMMHALQPIAAASLRKSGVGANTEWGKSLQKVLDDPRSVASFQAGFNQGVIDGGKSMVEGAWSLVKAGYNTNPVGWLVEGAQKVGILGEVPSWVPDAGRVIEPASKIATGIGNYISEVNKNPAKFGDDVKAWIGANWNSIKASHAAAAAKGGAAEAEWWGKIAGRATFEIAAVVVPVTKVASAAKAAEAMSLLLKAGKISEVFTEAARAGKLAELVSGAVKAGKMAEVVAEARTAGKLVELAAAAKKAGKLNDVLAAARASGGVEGLAGKAGLQIGDIAVLQKAGRITADEASLARGMIAKELGIPRGFASVAEYSSFGKTLRQGLRTAGFPTTEPILQGSAVTGKSFAKGTAFDIGRVSDFDVALSGKELLQAAKDAGVALRSGGTRTGPLSARDLQALGLRDLANQMSKQAGREVNFMIYESVPAATERSASMILPK
jgi:hypothetical protein